MNLITTRIPRRYTFSWDTRKKAIVLYVHRDCLMSFPLVLSSSPLVVDLKGNRVLGSFSLNLLDDHFGINRTIVKTSESAGYFEYTIALPEIRTITDTPCDKCDGTGIRELQKDTCPVCMGDTKKRKTNMQRAYDTTASLECFLYLLEYCTDTSAREPQHIKLRMLSREGREGSALGGYFGIDFVKYLHNHHKNLRETVAHEVVEAMKSAHHIMDRTRDVTHSLNCSLPQGDLTLTCPDDACNVSMTHHGSGTQRGREFSSHNVDRPIQSLTLLAGLASLIGQVDLRMTQR